jgi:hypothetical protein
MKQPGRDADVRHGYPPTDTDSCGDRFNQPAGRRQRNGPGLADTAAQPAPFLVRTKTAGAWRIGYARVGSPTSSTWRSTCCSFDTTSTYFETEEADQPIARDEHGRPVPGIDGKSDRHTVRGFRSFGKSKDHRDDLPQVVIGMAVTCACPIGR